jgi:hypothetical protein
MQTIPQSKLRAVIWIDHEMALIVVTKDNYLVKKEILHSNLDQQLHEERHHEHPLHKETRRKEILKRFYKTVLFRLKNIDQILVTGPAEAKYELGTQLEHHKGLKGKFEGISSTAKMHNHELINYAERYWADNDSADSDFTSKK